MHLSLLLLTLALVNAEDASIKDGDVIAPELESGLQPPPSAPSRVDNDDDYDAPPVDPLPPDVHAPAFPKLSPAEDQNDFTTTEDPAEEEEDFDLPTKKPDSVPNIAEINRTEIEQEGMIISFIDDYLDVSENGSFTGENSTKTEMRSGTIIIGERIPNNPVVDKFGALPSAVVVSTPEQIVIDKISIDEKKTVDDESEALSASERKESLEELPGFEDPKEIKDEQPFIVRAQAKDSLGEDHFISEDVSKPISKKKEKELEKRTENIAATVADTESSNANKEKVFGKSESHKDNKDLTAKENRAIDDFFNGIDADNEPTSSPTPGPFLKIDSVSKGKDIVIGYTPDKSSKRFIVHAFDLGRMKMREVGADSSSFAKKTVEPVTPDTEITSTLPTSTSKITNEQLTEILKAEQSTSKTIADAEHLGTETTTDSPEKVFKFGDVMEIMSMPDMHNRRNTELSTASLPPEQGKSAMKKSKKNKKKKLDRPDDSPLLEKLPIKKLVQDSTNGDETTTVGSLPWDSTILPGTVITLEESSTTALPSSEPMKKKPRKKIVRKSKKSKNKESPEFTPQNETLTISTTVDDFPKPEVLPEKEIQLEFPVPLSVLPVVPEVLPANETISMGINFVPFVANSTSKEEVKVNSTTAATHLKPKKNEKVPVKSSPKNGLEKTDKNDTLEDLPKPKDLNLLFPLDFPHLDKDISDDNPSSPTLDALKGRFISPDFDRLEIRKEETMDTSPQNIHVTASPSESSTAKIPSKPQVWVEKVSVSGLSGSDVLGTKPAFLIVETPKPSDHPVTDKQTDGIDSGHNLIISVPSDFGSAKKSTGDEQPIGKPLIVNLPFSHPLPLNITITRKKTQRKHSKSTSHPEEDSGTISASNKSPWRIKMRPKSGLKLEQIPSVLPQATSELQPLTPEEKAFNEGRAKSEDQPAKMRTTKATTRVMTTTTEGMYVTAPGERTTVPLEVLHFPTEEDVSADEPILSESFEEMVQKTLKEPEAKTMEFSLQEEEDFLKATIPPSDLGTITEQQSDLPVPSTKDSLFSNIDFIKKIDYRPNGEILSTQAAAVPTTTEEWKPYQFDCSVEVDDKGALCVDWAAAGLCTSKPTMFLFCRKTCLCSGPPRS